MTGLTTAAEVDDITAADVAELVGALTAKGRKRETVRKSLLVLAMIFDHAGVAPNPARDKIVVKLPREQKAEIAPPTAEHVRAVHDVLPAVTGCRCSCLTRRGCGSASLRASGGVTSTNRGAAGASQGPWRRPGRALGLGAPDRVRAVMALVAREDRTAERKVFQGSMACGSAMRSHAHASHPERRRSRPTIYGTAGPASSTSAVCRGRGSVNTSVSATSP
jgi:hypothetical protein